MEISEILYNEKASLDFTPNRMDKINPIAQTHTHTLKATSDEPFAVSKNKLCLQLLEAQGNF